MSIYIYDIVKKTPKGKILRSRLIKVGIVIIFVITAFLTLISLYKIITTTAPDYSVLWNAAKDLPTSKNPYLNKELYTGVGYPPNTLLFYLPLSLLPYEISQALFVLLSLIALIASIYLSIIILFKRLNPQVFLLATAMVFLAFPSKFTLGMGQNNSISLLLLLLAFYFYFSKKDWPSGFFLGLSIVFKTIFGFFFLFFLIKARWKLIISCLFVITLSTVLIHLISASEINLYGYYIKNVIPPLLNYEGREIYFNQGIVGFISRLFENLALRRTLSEILSLVLVSTIVILNIKRRNQDILGFSSFVISLLLVDTLSWQHHFVWLIFPFFVLISESFKRRKYAFLLLISISYLLIGWNFKNPTLYAEFPKVLLLSNTFYGTVFLLFVNLYFLVTSSDIRAKHIH